MGRAGSRGAAGRREQDGRKPGERGTTTQLGFALSDSWGDAAEGVPQDWAIAGRPAGRTEKQVVRPAGAQRTMLFDWTNWTRARVEQPRQRSEPRGRVLEVSREGAGTDKARTQPERPGPQELSAPCLLFGLATTC